MALASRYFDKLLAKSFEHMGQRKTVYDALVKKFIYIQEEQTFFAAAFRYDEQNSLRQHDFDLILDFYEKLICEKTGKVPDENLRFLLEMYCHSSIYMTVRWDRRVDMYAGRSGCCTGGWYARKAGRGFYRAWYSELRCLKYLEI